MDTPHRKTYRRPNLGIVDTARTLTNEAAQYELGWLALRENLHGAGWPARIPTDDRKPSVRRMTVRCLDCGHTHIDETTWQYECRDERGHSAFAAITPPDPSSIDYADRTGDLAMNLERWHRDLDALQDARHALEKAIRAIATITRKYLVDMPPAIPLCSRNGCDNEVERRVGHTTGKVSYVGMEDVGGVWISKVGVAPECSKHRTASRRDAA